MSVSRSGLVCGGRSGVDRVLGADNFLLEVEMGELLITVALNPGVSDVEAAW